MPPCPAPRSRAPGTGILRFGELAPARWGPIEMPDWLGAILRSGVTVVVLIGIIMLLAALFMVIFGIATGIDERIQE